MNLSEKKILKQQKKREEIKQKALAKGWRSRWTLLRKAWSGVDKGAHLEWLGYYEAAEQVKAMYKIGAVEALKMGLEVTNGMMTGLVNSELSSGGIYDSTSNTLYTGHINNNVGYKATTRNLKTYAYKLKEVFAIIGGKYETDAFGLPVRWSKPKS